MDQSGAQPQEPTTPLPEDLFLPVAIPCHLLEAAEVKAAEAVSAAPPAAAPCCLVVAPVEVAARRPTAAEILEDRRRRRQTRSYTSRVQSIPVREPRPTAAPTLDGAPARALAVPSRRIRPEALVGLCVAVLLAVTLSSLVQVDDAASSPRRDPPASARASAPSPRPPSRVELQGEVAAGALPGPTPAPSPSNAAPASVPRSMQRAGKLAVALVQELSSLPQGEAEARLHERLAACLDADERAALIQVQRRLLLVASPRALADRTPPDAAGIAQARSPSALEELRELVSDPARPAEVRAAAATALGSVNLPDFERALRDVCLGADAAGRVLALEELARRKELAPETLAAVERAAADPDPLVRAAGVRAAGSSPDAAPRLLTWLGHESDPRVVAGLYEALGRVGGPEHVPALLDQGRHDPQAALAVARISRRAGQLVPEGLALPPESPAPPLSSPRPDSPRPGSLPTSGLRRPRGRP